MQNSNSLLLSSSSVGWWTKTCLFWYIVKIIIGFFLQKSIIGHAKGTKLKSSIEIQAHRHIGLKAFYKFSNGACRGYILHLKSQNQDFCRCRLSVQQLLREVSRPQIIYVGKHTACQTCLKSLKHLYFVIVYLNLQCCQFTWFGLLTNSFVSTALRRNSEILAKFWN